MGKTIQTSYGAVDARALSRLRERFDTRRLFDAIDAIDRIRCRICAADGMRQDLLDLHSMAHEIINEDYGGSSSSRKEPIWELAEMLSGEVLEFRDDLRSVFDTLEEMERLRPAEDDEDGGGGSEEEGDDYDGDEEEDEDREEKGGDN